MGVFEILKTMCDTLEDRREIFSECDRALGDFNRASGKQEYPGLGDVSVKMTVSFR